MTGGEGLDCHIVSSDRAYTALWHTPKRCLLEVRKRSVLSRAEVCVSLSVSAGDVLLSLSTDVFALFVKSMCITLASHLLHTTTADASL